MATVVFVLFTVYPVVTKPADGRLAHDWTHSALHLVSALFGAWAGWLATSEIYAKLFTVAIGVTYLVLGVYGWCGAPARHGSSAAVTRLRCSSNRTVHIGS